MVEQLGINVLVPIIVFSVVIVGAILLSNIGLADVKQRRDRGEV